MASKIFSGRHVILYYAKEKLLILSREERQQQHLFLHYHGTVVRRHLQKRINQ